MFIDGRASQRASIKGVAEAIASLQWSDAEDLALMLETWRSRACETGIAPVVLVGWAESHLKDVEISENVYVQPPVENNEQ